VGKSPIVDIRAILEQQFDHVINVGMVKCPELESLRLKLNLAANSLSSLP
jgi:hypothetical protein